jgi:spore coat protein U-like protein
MSAEKGIVFFHMQMFIKSSRLAAMGFVAGLLSVSGSALAADNAPMVVTAEVAEVCDVTASPLAFGAYNPLAATALGGTATVTVTCTSGILAGIELDDGLNANTGSTADIPLRRINSGTNFLNYQLSQDSGHVTVWGGSPATDVAHTGTGAPVALTVHGRIPALQNVPAGDYADTIGVLVVF